MSHLSVKFAAAASPSGQASPAPSRTSTPSVNDSAKRKRPTGPPTGIWSQPQDTGTGRHIMTQVQFAIDHLKSKDHAISFRDIFNYLSIPNATTADEVTLRHILRTHPKVEYDHQGLGGKGSYRFRPVHNVRSADELMGFLQSQTTAQGIKASNLKDGWSGALDVIDQLEEEHKLLVTRNRKDNSAKMVWPNDPSLVHKVDAEFTDLWRLVQVPVAAGDLRKELLAYGLTPTSQVKVLPKSVEQKKKKKVNRKSGRTTNTHMAGLLRDYSHLRRE